MKKTQLLTSITALLLLLLSVSLVACIPRYTETDVLWEDAKYTKDTTLGNGKNIFTCTVEAGEKSIVFTVKSDKATLGEALYEHQLVSDPIFFDTCNGIEADYSKNQAYWKFSVDGTTVNYGIGDAKSVAGKAYKLSYTVGGF